MWLDGTVRNDSESFLLSNGGLVAAAGVKQSA